MTGQEARVPRMFEKGYSYSLNKSKNFVEAKNFRPVFILTTIR